MSYITYTTNIIKNKNWNLYILKYFKTMSNKTLKITMKLNLANRLDGQLESEIGL